MNDLVFQKLVTAWLSCEAYEKLRAIPGPTRVALMLYLRGRR